MVTHDDSQAPATKQDIKMLMDMIGHHFDGTQSSLGAMRAQMHEWKHELFDEIKASEKRLMLYMDHKFDEIMDLFRSQQADILDHGTRIGRLEERAGLARL